MLNLKDRNRGIFSKLVPQGTHIAEVLSVEWCDSDRYGFEGAYEVIYQITTEDGRVFRHREVFKTTLNNKRTRDFENYLADNGIENLDDFVGKREKLTFQHKIVDGYTFSNIVKREFLS